MGQIKQSVRGAVLALLAGFVVGCSSTAAPEKNKLLVWHVGSEEEAQIIQKLAEEKFTPTSGVEVRCESMAWAEAHSKYLTAMAGDVTPDVGTMGLTWGTEFGSKGQMTDLRKAYGADLEVLKAATFPSIWEATEYRGAVYGVPYDMSLMLMYYRKDLVPTPPGTWQEMVSLLEKLALKKQNLLMDWGSMDWIGFAPFLWQAGGDYYNVDKTRSTIDQPEAVTALTFYADLYRKYGVPKAGQGVAQGMRSADFPVGISGNWLINSLPVDAPELEGKWAIAPLLAGPSGKRTGFIGGRAMGIFARSTRQDEAWSFIKFLSQEDVQQEIYKEVAKSHNIYMPPNMKAWDALPMSSEIKDVLVAQARDAKAPPSVLGWNDSTRFVVEAIQKAVVKGGDPKTLLAGAAKAMNERIEK
ncbi:MAG: extracellular solute-binding protein [Elusimicrobia bacterium]|nr:extracellular solute-binding protein [Elusimicrobiota bacterium]